MSSNRATFIFLLFIFFIGLVFVIKFGFGGSENNWVCSNGVWVKHGNPLGNPPKNHVCTKSQMVGNDKDEHGCIPSAGYTWCEEKQKCLRDWEEPCTQEAAFNILTSIKTGTEIDFSSISKSSFVWNTVSPIKETPSQSKDIIESRTIVATNVEKTSVNNIATFLEDEGFSKDDENVSTGTDSGTQGLTKDSLGCLINYKNSPSSTTSATAKINMSVSCGDLKK